MKFKVTLKDPDALYEAIAYAVDNMPLPPEVADCREIIAERRQEQLKRNAEKWFFDCAEYLTVEIDTDAMTCVVLEVERGL